MAAMSNGSEASGFNYQKGKNMDSFSMNATVVLIHGALADGSSWNRVILPLLCDPDLSQRSKLPAFAGALAVEIHGDWLLGALVT